MAITRKSRKKKGSDTHPSKAIKTRHKYLVMEKNSSYSLPQIWRPWCILRSKWGGGGKRIPKSNQVTRHQQPLDDRRVVFIGTAHDSWRNNCKAERECLEYILPLDAQMKDAIHKHSTNVN